MVIYIAKYNAAKEAGETLPRVTEYIGYSIKLIAEGLSTKPDFIGYSYRDEMISDGIENCLMYLHNFNPSKYKNPFAYFTTIIYYAFLRRIQKEQKQQYIKHKTLINSSIMNSLVDMSPEDASHFNVKFTHMDAVKSRDLVEKFEKTNTTKKSKTDKPEVIGLEEFIIDDIIEDDIIE
jgi:hypothetical protein